jgi:hypothetical protein
LRETSSLKARPMPTHNGSNATAMKNFAHLLTGLTKAKSTQ